MKFPSCVSVTPCLKIFVVALDYNRVGTTVCVILVKCSAQFLVHREQLNKAGNFGILELRSGIFTVLPFKVCFGGACFP